MLIKSRCISVTSESPILHLLCGKIAAGKSTLAKELAQRDGAVLIVEDDWLASLYGEQMTTPRDFIRYASKLRDILGPHITQLLRAHVSVVLDFQANTVESRQWMHGIINQSQAAHQLHVLSPPDEVCLARLRARNASGTHPFTVTEAQFHQVTRYFAPPTAEEGFNLIVHD